MTETELSFDALLAAPRLGIGREMRYRKFRIVRIPDDCGNQWSVVDADTRDEVSRFNSDDFDDTEVLRWWLDERHTDYWE